VDKVYTVRENNIWRIWRCIKMAITTWDVWKEQAPGSWVLVKRCITEKEAKTKVDKLTQKGVKAKYYPPVS
jgi:hypothetical protein